LFSSATHGWSNQEIMDRKDRETSGKQWLLQWHWLHVGNGSSHKQVLHCRWQQQGHQEHSVKKEMIGDQSFWQPFQNDSIIWRLFFFFRCTRNPWRQPRRQRCTSSTFSTTIATPTTVLWWWRIEQYCSVEEWAKIMWFNLLESAEVALVTHQSNVPDLWQVNGQRRGLLETLLRLSCEWDVFCEKCYKSKVFKQTWQALDILLWCHVSSSEWVTGS
jgi:hypothetical protein